jgi:hypothetical protein
MPKLTNKTLARKALKTIEPKGVEPVKASIQLTPEGTEASEVQQNDAKLSKIGQEIKKAEALLSEHNSEEAEEPLVDEHGRKMAPNGLVYGHRRDVDISEVHKTSIDKHVESMRYKIVWVANKLADELIHETSKKTKKDKEYIKGLVWSFGTMYDKLAGISTDTVQVHIPTKLLEGVKSAISIQIARVQTELTAGLRSLPQGEVINVAPLDVTSSKVDNLSSITEVQDTIVSPPTT